MKNEVPKMILEPAMEKRTLKQMSKSCVSKEGTKGHLAGPKGCLELQSLLWSVEFPGCKAGGARAEGLRQGPEHARCQSCAPRAAPQLRARARGRGLRTPGPGAPVRFFLRIPGRGAGSEVGLQRGGFPPSCEQRTGPSPGWELRPSGGATEREHEHWAESGERTTERVTGESVGRTEPPQRTDAPGGALAPEGVSGSQIEQLGNPRAERGRAGSPGQSCGGRVNGLSPHPSRVCHRPGWQCGGWVLEVSLLK